MPVFNIARLVGLLMLVVLLAGACAGVERVAEDADARHAEALEEEQGLVAVKLAVNGHRIAERVDAWRLVYAIDLDDEDNIYYLQAVSTGLAGSRVYIGALPEGSYALLALHSSYWIGDVVHRLTAPIPRSLGTFQVVSGYLTSLGSLVFQPLGEIKLTHKQQRIFFAMTRLDGEENLDLFVSEKYPELYQELRSNLALGWNPDDLDDYRLEMTERIRSFAVGLDFHRIDGDRLAMTGAMGHVFLRHADGDWQRIDTGYTHQLKVLKSYPGGYLAAGERGLVLRADSLDGQWSVMPGPSQREAIFWMDYLEDAGVWFALTHEGSKARLYRVEQDFSNWIQVHALDRRPIGDYLERSPVYAAVMPDETIAMIGYMRRVLFDANGNQLDDRPSRRASFGALLPLSDGSLVASALWRGQAMISDNAGRSWRTIRGSRPFERLGHGSRGVPVIQSDGSIFALSYRGYQNVKERRWEYEGEPRLRLADSDGKILHWGEVLDPECLRLVPELSDDTAVFAACADGRLLMTRDRGQTWQVDFDSGADLESERDSDLLGHGTFGT